jgi:hypothetical protein
MNNRGLYGLPGAPFMNGSSCPQHGPVIPFRYAEYLDILPLTTALFPEVNFCLNKVFRFVPRTLNT